MDNPFEEISGRLANVEILLQKILNNSQDQSPKKYLKTEEAAEYLHVSVSQLYSLTSQEKIPFIKKGKRLLFVPEQLDKWLVNSK